jgi:hypothetical protein
MTQQNRRWTLMVYMAGDNGKVFEQLKGKRLMAPMEEQGYQDIQQMEAVGSTDEVSVLVQFDTLSDHEHTYRIYIRPSGEPRQIENIPEHNMGDSRALRDFIFRHYLLREYLSFPSMQSVKFHANVLILLNFLYAVLARLY